jgi:phage virion morphogenesis protein
MDELHALDDWARALLARLSPAARRTLARDLARELRRQQQARIAAQRNPDGSPYAPRKRQHDSSARKLRNKKGRIKRAAMFRRLRSSRFMRVEADANGLAVGFAGRVARIARVHQFGELDGVAPGGVEYRYPARRLLGLAEEERDRMRSLLVGRLMR